MTPCHCSINLKLVSINNLVVDDYCEEEEKKEDDDALKIKDPIKGGVTGCVCVCVLLSFLGGKRHPNGLLSRESVSG